MNLGKTLGTALLITFVVNRSNANSAYELYFSSQADNTTVGVTLPNVVVQVADKSGSNVAVGGVPISMVLNHGSLYGTTNLSTDAFGKAVFTNLIVPQVGSSYKLTATTTGIKSANGSAFNVGMGSTTTAITSSTNLLVYGQSVTFTAIASSANPLTGAPTGIVTFNDGSAILGTATLNSAGVATFVTNRMSATNPSHLITAVYGGDTNFLGSTSINLVQATARLPLNISGIVASNKTYDGTTGATVNFAGASLVAILAGDSVTLGFSSATAVFSDASTGSGKNILITGLVLSGPSAGNYFLAATQTATASISPAPLLVTTPNVTRSYGTTNPVLLATYSGFVTGESLANSDVTGSPVLTTTAQAGSYVGIYPVVVSQGTLASANYSFNFADGSLTVTKADTTALLATSLNPALTNQNITFAATVNPASACAVPPSGVIQFRCNGTNQLGNAVPLSGCAANICVLAATLGLTNAVITAEYSDPSGNFNPSTNSVTQNLIAPVAPPPPSTLSLAQVGTDGAVAGQVNGTAGQTYVIQASTDLMNWSSISTNVADTNGIVWLVDSNSISIPARFYRAFSP
jgi:hypothetical protein